MTHRSFRKRSGFWRAEGGSTVVEFALVVPLFVLLTIGAIGLSTMTAMNSALQFATEKAARCAAVSATSNTGCTDQSSTSSYAISQYKGPTITGLTFTLTASDTCGGPSVTGAGAFVLVTGLTSISKSLSVKACYPKTS